MQKYLAWSPYIRLLNKIGRSYKKCLFLFNESNLLFNKMKNTKMPKKYNITCYSIKEMINISRFSSVSVNIFETNILSGVNLVN